jgi:hypothetical protein
MPPTPTKVIVVPALVDLDFTVAPDNDGRRPWTATTADHVDAAFRGLTATGPTFAEARKHLAELVALAAKNTPPFAELDAVRVLALTRKTFPLSELNLDQNGQAE